MFIASRYAYIEFDSRDAAMKAKLHTDSLFKGRQITVIPKRKNIQGYGAGPAMGRGGRGGVNQLVNIMAMMLNPRGMARGRGFRPNHPRGGAAGAGSGKP